MARPPSVLFLGMTYLGWGTRFRRLMANTCADLRIEPRYAPVTGWREGGRIETLRGLPGALRGRLRSAAEASAFAGVPRPDVIWTSAPAAATPFLAAQLGPLRRPVVLELDWTLDQQEAWAEEYFGRPPKRGTRRALARMAERAFWRQVTLFTPVSEWTADALRAAGVEEDRILVHHPGVDLETFRPPARGRPLGERPLRLLFVGGDFRRKGGDLLVEALRGPLAGRCELDIVTRDPAVASEPGMRVHRAEPGSPLLHELFDRADLFAMPSRAECYGFATIEALASGLPAIAGDVGGGRSIVDDGETGWLIAPTTQGVVGALERALRERERLPVMGARARAVAEARFDARANDAALVGRLVELAARR